MPNAPLTKKESQRARPVSQWRLAKGWGLLPWTLDTFVAEVYDDEVRGVWRNDPGDPAGIEK